MSEQLKPCPFCGGAASVRQEVGEPIYFVNCDPCGCETRSGDRGEVIAAWNKRSDACGSCEDYERRLEKAREEFTDLKKRMEYIKLSIVNAYDRAHRALLHTFGPDEE